MMEPPRILAKPSDSKHLCEFCGKTMRKDAIVITYISSKYGGRENWKFAHVECWAKKNRQIFSSKIFEKDFVKKMQKELLLEEL